MAKIFLNDGAPWPKNSLTSLESYHLCIFPMFRQILTRRKAIVLSIEIHFQILGGVLLYHNSVDLFNHCEDDASENIRCTLKTIAGCISTACHNARGRVKSSSASASSSVSLGSKKKGSATAGQTNPLLGSHRSQLSASRAIWVSGILFYLKPPSGLLPTFWRQTTWN